jgi:transcriptional regulator with XRE-family HTH domain
LGDNDKVSYIGDYIKTLRNAKKYSQRKLGYLSKVSNATINRIERGITRPTPETLKKLAGPLGAPYEELLYMTGYLNLDASLINFDSVKKIIEKRGMSFDELSNDIEAVTGIKIPAKVLEDLEKGKVTEHESDYIIALARYEGIDPKLFYKSSATADLDFVIKETMGELKERLDQMNLGYIKDKKLKEWVNDPASLKYLLFAKKLYDMKINPDFVLKEFINKIFNNGKE